MQVKLKRSGPRQLFAALVLSHLDLEQRLQLDSFDFSYRLHGLTRMPHHLRQVKVVLVQLEFELVNLGQIEEIID